MFLHLVQAMLFATMLTLPTVHGRSKSKSKEKDKGKGTEDEPPQFDTYFSRPDIESPRWNMTVYDKNQLAPGYWFIGPYENILQKSPGGRWIGPHIYDNNGDLIWSGAHMFDNMNVHDFRVSNVGGIEMLQGIRFDLGVAYLLDHSYEIVDTIHMGEYGIDMNMHELNFVDNGSRALILTKNFTNATTEMSQAIHYDGECFVKFDGFSELSVGDWRPQFEWSAYGQIGLEESTLQSVGSKCKTHWDYSHANAVDKCPDGDYILSARHMDAIYKISHVDGSIVWRLGGIRSDFQMGDLNFSRQHDVRCRSQNSTHTVISFLDNAKGEDSKRPTAAHSRALLVSLSTETYPMTAHIEAAYDHPDGDGAYTWRRGNYQIMSGGDHAFVCWSERALISEYAADGTLLMQARLIPTFLGTYRAYKFPWIGAPTAPPDVYAAARNDFDEAVGRMTTTTRIHVSWNGATEVVAWRVYKTTDEGREDVEVVIATEWKAGFETTLVYPGFASYVVAEAFNADGESLGRSRITRTVMPQDGLTVDVANEVLWLQETDSSEMNAEEEPPVDNAEGNLVDEEEDSSDMAPIIGFVLGFFSSVGLCCIVWVSWYKRKDWRWRQHYRDLAQGDHELEEVKSAEKGHVRYDVYCSS